MTTVLAAIDLADDDPEALLQAHDYARRNGDRLVVCHVVDKQPAAGAAVRAALDQRIAATLVVPAVAFESVVAVGKPAETIVGVAGDLQARLTVVGAGRHTGLARLLGGVAEHVVRHARAPVLVARPPHGRGPVVAATDFSDPALPAVAAAIAEARLRGVRLHLLHCVAPLMPVAGELVYASWPTDQLAELRGWAEGHLRGSLARFDADGEVVVRFGEAAREIVALAEELGAELVVVGSHGRTGFERLALGSVAESVTRRAPVSVLVVRLQPPP